ncbi:flavin reductase (DIM6/NTAB) family NADH-FMN oxidoreductase RutF [Lipingzhangella halophila]|uniref:Flavin reductase (DIM6/NTAB) family NADH-FMN oxidoreductase RutF n=1 Tax=Lipingzhangella halophila TaxID=1783352 RepID=A0A7W7RP29_9ACTN|nr:flavin reductase family protein [Lipingzhangella halophila]MBB4935272.1 flavin reductase (DIM6/NTAB) family NADH-FMN oxidoreductase RutF [Lipingzhangella halophila]
MRTDLTRADLPGRDFYAWLTAVVVPRPIAWVSTTSQAGVDNLAPHSFFTVASADPPIVQFTSVRRKDSVTNAEATGEFVVNFAPERLQREINATGTGFPPETSEFDAVGVEREPSAAVTPPRVAASPVALECRLHSTLPMGDSILVFGEVVRVSVHSDVVVDGLPDVNRLRPIARLGRNEWGALGEVTALNRIRYADWPDGHQS